MSFLLQIRTWGESGSRSRADSCNPVANEFLNTDPSTLALKTSQSTDVRGKGPARTRGVEPMTGLCWASVADAGPT